MTETQMLEAKAVYKKYIMALDAYVHNIDDDGVHHEWVTAYNKWVKTMRDMQIGRRDRETIHEEVVAELRA